MKALSVRFRGWVVAMSLGCSGILLGQGRLELSNRGTDNDMVRGAFFAPVYASDGYTPLAGSRYSAQLYAARSQDGAEALAPVGAVVLLGEAPGLVYSPSFITVPGVPAGSTALLQLRCWDNGDGQFATWEAAAVRGSSDAFLSELLVNPGGIPRPLTRMKSFKLSPAPAVLHAGDSGVRGDFSYEHTGYVGPGIFCPESSAHYVALSGDGQSVVYMMDESPCNAIQFRLVRNSGTTVVASTPASKSGLALDPGVDVWAMGGISRDGSTLVGHSWKHPLWSITGAFVGHPVLGDELPLSEAYAVDSDGWLVLGRKDSRRLVRLDRRRGTSDDVGVPVVDGDPWAQVPLGFSGDGGTVLWAQENSPVVRHYLWRAGTGNTELDLQGFIPRVLSRNGRVLGGHKGQTPGFWTESEGWHPLPGTGSVTAISEDGSVLAGGSTVWARDGRQFGLTELVHDPSVAQLAGLFDVESRALSDDGRTLLVEGRNYVFPGVFRAVPVRVGFTLKIELPGDGPALAVVRGGEGDPVVRFRGRAGLNYRLLVSPDLQSWNPVGELIPGKEGSIEAPLPVGEAASGFFRISAEGL